ncbi:G protein-coupled receptor gprM [Exophiala dermatitidis]|uniref:G-protein coupled receptors family 2 profile 2 domain-containing protein n=2 Tax=Exophiala dermatitidis TaxID=5970 RepID=H6C6M8_EXODN|nr:hypothetical protein, variant [Exophiala dermatitidis NIH/UT8656]KAJ4546883.1 hypothetical protein HRR77_004424 [Exophiala dermatitidis]EHY59374.1 hypothetical protein, variant [Exophiala dermatitidis NIH/UT8656]KAJ4573755.1 hypothetical protein HRR79_002765 [Exophiala dermatitidis]KAJ4623698.1 hypothetical protein HRR85_000556 [Exophiala dermatitidis]KAJ4630942.1 hypothetical protein HRR86_002482 [Exophiala dermatitidis]
MSSLSDLRGLCPAPFLQESVFPDTGGFTPGRFCMPLPDLHNLTCCLPCPLSDWAYSDGFESRTEIANWVNVAAFILSVYLILSFAILPVKFTHRHYLSVCLTLGVVFLELAFIIPQAAKPDQCFNEITPNDMHSSGVCAVSGAFLLFGGWAIVIWVFCRALALHLQICWEVVPGDKFFYTSLAFGWGIPIVGLALTLSLTGVSFRFGNVCHINHKDALQDFWGPLLAFAALGLVLQFITIGYCVHVYMKSILDDKPTTNDSSQAPPTYSNSMRTVSARQTYRRVKRVVQLQWRGASIVLVITAEVVFFSVVFVSMDNSTQINEQLLRKATPWLNCLALAQGDKTKCLSYTKGLVKSEGVVLAVLIILGLSGFWCLMFLGRWSMTHGWIEFLRNKFPRRKEFVSADARRLSTDPHRVMTNPNPRTVLSPDPDTKQGYFDSAQAYISPVSSHSSPRSPSRSHNWNPRSTFAGPAEVGKETGTKTYLG